MRSKIEHDNTISNKFSLFSELDNVQGVQSSPESVIKLDSRHKSPGAVILAYENSRGQL